jgi:hypothetical protein
MLPHVISVHWPGGVARLEASPQTRVSQVLACLRGLRGRDGGDPLPLCNSGVIVLFRGGRVPSFATLGQAGVLPLSAFSGETGDVPVPVPAPLAENAARGEAHAPPTLVVRRRAHCGARGLTATLIRALGRARYAASADAPAGEFAWSISAVGEALAMLLTLPRDVSLSPFPFGDLVDEVLEASGAALVAGATLPLPLVKTLRGPALDALSGALRRMFSCIHVRSRSNAPRMMPTEPHLQDRLSLRTAAEAAAMGAILRAASDKGRQEDLNDDEARAPWESGSQSSACEALRVIVRLVEDVAEGSPASMPVAALNDVVRASAALFSVASEGGGSALSAAAAAEHMSRIIALSADLADAAAATKCSCRTCRALLLPEMQGRGREEGRTMLALGPEIEVSYGTVDDESEDEDEDEEGAVLRVNAVRSDVAVSTYRCISALDDAGRLNDWSMGESPRLHVRFAGENGLGDGVMRDWLSALFEELFDPANGVFRCCASKPSLAAAGRIVHPAPDGAALSPKLASVAPKARWIWLAGVSAALAARTRVPIGHHLGDAFACLVQGRPSAVDVASIEQLEPSVATSCRAVLAADTQAKIDALALPGFCYGDRDLLPGGASVSVRPENRRTLVQLITMHVSIDGHACEGARAFRSGFVTAAGVAPSAALAALRIPPAILNAAIGGHLEVPADSLLARVQVIVGPGVSRALADEFVAVFRLLVRTMDDTRRRQLLRFWTGTPGVHACTSMPVDVLQLVVVHARPPGGRMPYSHTCYSQLSVPVSDLLGAEDAGSRLASAIDSSGSAMYETDDYV